MTAANLPLGVKVALRAAPVGRDTRYSPREAAAIAGISVSSLYQDWKAGLGPKRSSVNGRPKIVGADLLRWMNASRD